MQNHCKNGRRSQLQPYQRHWRPHILRSNNESASHLAAGPAPERWRNPLSSQFNARRSGIYRCFVGRRGSRAADRLDANVAPPTGDPPPPGRLRPSPSAGSPSLLHSRRVGAAAAKEVSKTAGEVGWILVRRSGKSCSCAVVRRRFGGKE